MTCPVCGHEHEDRSYCGHPEEVTYEEGPSGPKTVWRCACDGSHPVEQIAIVPAELPEEP